MARNHTKPTTSVTEETTDQQTEPTHITSSNKVTQETVQNGKADTHKRKSAISKFAETRYNAPISNICIFQVINHMEAEKVGLFIKDKYLAGINWQGQEPTHKHTFSSGTPEMGVLLQSPRMHVLDVSPRYIEQRDDGKIVGVYESPDGYEMYRAPRTHSRRLHLLMCLMVPKVRARLVLPASSLNLSTVSQPMNRQSSPAGNATHVRGLQLPLPSMSPNWMLQAIAE